MTKKQKYIKKWRKKNKKRISLQSKEYYKNNKEKIKERKQRNQAKINEYQKEWRHKNKEKIKQYNMLNKKKIKQYKQTYIEKNYKKVLQQKNEYQRKPIGRFKKAQYSAKKRKLNWNILFDEYVHLINQSCYYSKNHKLPETGIGLDRINNNEGYNISNVVPCCEKCNLSRGNRYSFEEWKIMIKALETFKQKDEDDEVH